MIHNLTQKCAGHYFDLYTAMMNHIHTHTHTGDVFLNTVQIETQEWIFNIKIKIQHQNTADLRKDPSVHELAVLVRTKQGDSYFRHHLLCDELQSALQSVCHFNFPVRIIELNTSRDFWREEVVLVDAHF